MDFIVEIIRDRLLYFVGSIALIIVIKAYMVSNVKRFDIAEIFFSFFRFYSQDEVNMSSNRKRISFMRWNNLLNYLLYFITGLVLLIYMVTRNS
ncbi:MAG: hypothetical protein KF781_11455 [Chitinophagaceae bacterium]|nr:hypothetical protein [Chitinophagaceae bacterium]MCW5905807.1 hypothetical protein [Chitinophagaceae bacterium]